MKLPRSQRAVYFSFLTLFLVLSGWLWTWALPKFIERGCWLGEWPFEDGCEQYPSGVAPDTPPEVFYKYLQRNPGDSRAWARLVHALWVRKDPRALDVLPVAKKMNPYSNLVLAVEAEAAIQAKDWPTAAQALAYSVQRGNNDAIRPLVAMMTTAETQASVLKALNEKSTWLDTALNNLDPKLSPLVVQQFISEGARLKVMKPETALNMIDRMKNAGDVVDAYSLWVGMRDGVPEGLFNASFDQRSIQRAFDWQWSQATAAGLGLYVRQATAAPQPGSLLEVEMTGRAALPQPMVAQTLVLFGDRYRFKGTYMADRLRTTDGLVWALRCAAGGDRFAQTAAIKDTQRKWTSFSLDVKVPPQCGAAVKLQLEAASPGEAGAGMAGMVYFDDFELKPAVAVGDKG